MHRTRALRSRLPNFVRLCVAAFAVGALHSPLIAEDAAKTDARYPFRTDFANAHLPWYAPKPLEFPPHHSDRRISGELVGADFIHRTGQFRTSTSGKLVEFTMPPYGAVNYLNAEAGCSTPPTGRNSSVTDSLRNDPSQSLNYINTP